MTQPTPSPSPHPSQSSPADFSRYLARLVQARPALAAEFSPDAPPLDAAQLNAWLQPESLTEDTLKPALRRLKQQAMARIASRDLDGRADLAEVVESMTLVAEAAVSAALAICETTLIARYGQPQNAQGERQQLIVIGMGKLGGRELNVSSDIDLIFVYPEDGDTAGPRSISNFEFFARVGKALISAIAEVTGDGQVFRVDMRLRPNGDSGPLVCSFEMLENYFITQGREWERYAWIKARPLTGVQLGGSGGHPPPLRVPQIPRLRHHQRHARPARADPPRSREEGHGQQRQARPRRHPRNRVHRPGLPADPRRPRPRLQIKPTLRGARNCSSIATSSNSTRSSNSRPPTLSAPARTSPAISRRRPDPCPAGKPRGPDTRRPRPWVSPITKGC